MLIFLDETFRTHKRTGNRLGVLSGVAVPEDAFHSLQSEIYHCRRPYHGQVLKPDDEMHGTHLLNNTTRRMLQEKGYSYHYNLVEDVLSRSIQRAARFRCRLFQKRFQHIRLCRRNQARPDVSLSLRAYRQLHAA